MNTIDYIAAVKARRGIASDYAFAKHMKISRSYVSAMQSGKEVMSNKLARDFARELDMHPGIVLLDAERERAERGGDVEMRNLWKEIFEGFLTLSRRANSSMGTLPRLATTV